MNWEIIQLGLIVSTLAIGFLLFLIRGIFVYWKFNKLNKNKDEKDEFEYKRVIIKKTRDLTEELTYNSKDRWKLGDFEEVASNYVLLFKRKKFRKGDK